VKGYRWIGLFALFVIVSGAYYVYHHGQGAGPEKMTNERTFSEQAPRRSQTSQSVSSPLSSEKYAKNRPESATIDCFVGSVTIKDITGHSIGKISAPVLSGGWIALPVRLCLGGYKWTLEFGSETVTIVEGILSDYDEVGLWRIQEDHIIEGPEIYPWNPEQPVFWIPIPLLDPPSPVRFESVEEQGYFLKGNMAMGRDEPGVFVQAGRVVGWNFGGLIDVGYMWAGEENIDLMATIRVDDFYRLTFADSREEEFTRALAMAGNASDLERLEAMTNAFRFEAKLSERDTPVHLRAHTVIAQIRSLIEGLTQQGYAREVAAIIDAPVLIEAADDALLVDVVQATAIGYGHENAIQLLEEVIEGSNVSEAEENPKLEQLLSRLYQRWLTALLENGDVRAAWQALERSRQNLPHDLDIHLFGVRLALAENDWAGAEALLSMKEYPASLTDEVRDLQTRISKLKGQAGKIVIRFSPGTKYIPVFAMLNQSVQQKFIVDTGATMVTIPSSTADSLGLTIDGGNPFRRVYTASGIVTAPEVVLPSILLDGWEVYDVQALVLDLPGQPDMGLLGMNYLKRFRMDLNNRDGILILEPR
jgi:clan AA aspartic protease (TIGR02281 family)